MAGDVVRGRHRQEKCAGVRRPAAGTRHRGDIQGLRAVAVVAVVLYHAGVPGTGGGYVGVDCFFVVSGYLITGLLVADAARHGRISFSVFYARRARRILPAAMLVLSATTVASVGWLAPLQARQVVRDCLASALFVGNYRFAVTGADYLAGDSAPSPVQHYWSLGVEEQFYLLWPLLIGVVVALGARLLHTRTPTMPVASVLAAVTVCSFLLGVRETHLNPPWAFFGLPTRAWELGVGGVTVLAGSALARQAPRRWLAAAGWLGLAGLAWSITQFSAHTPFPGTAALLPVISTALLLVSGTGTAARFAAGRALLDRAPVRWIGDLSYSLYLWHWPLLILVPVALGRPAGMPLRLGLVGASVLLAAATLQLVENPVRRTLLLRRPRRGLALGAALIASVTAVCTGAALLIPTSYGPGRAVPPIALPPVRPTTAAPPPSGASPTPTKPIAAWVKAEAMLAPVIVQAATARPVPANLDPPLSDAAADKAPPFVDGCNLTWTATFQPPCRYTVGARRLVILGDSHAAQWFPPLESIATAEHLQLESFTKATCPPLQAAVYSSYLGRPYTECASWLRDMLSRIRAERPALVVMGVARHYGSDIGFSVYSHTWDTGLAATVRIIRGYGIPVLVMGPTPKPPADVPNCLSGHLHDVAACNFSRAAGVNSAGAAGERLAVLAAGGSYLDAAPWICGPMTCDVVVGNLLVYRDDNHLTTSYTQWLQPVLQPAIDAALAGQRVD
jgi:peptidoglycan/LPS O-acetylase OafA/YrhL